MSPSRNHQNLRPCNQCSGLLTDLSIHDHSSPMGILQTHKWPFPSWLDSWVGRPLHQYGSPMGSNPIEPSSLHFQFQAFFSQLLLKLCTELRWSLWNSSFSLLKEMSYFLHPWIWNNVKFNSVNLNNKSDKCNRNLPPCIVSWYTCKKNHAINLLCYIWHNYSSCCFSVCLLIFLCTLVTLPFHHWHSWSISRAWISAKVLL